MQKAEGNRQKKNTHYPQRTMRGDKKRTRCYEVGTIKIAQQRQRKLVGRLEDELETISQIKKLGE